MGSGGYASRQQRMNLDVTVVGAGMSGNPEEYKDDGAFDTKDSAENSKSQGDQPAFTMPPFADGVDKRNRGQSAKE